jgi:hypothetical protein
MSLEQVIAENTSALNKLIEVWTTLSNRANGIDGSKPFAAAGVSLNPAPVAAKVTPPKPTPEATPAPIPVAAAVEVIVSPEIAAESPSEAPVEIKDLSAAVTSAATRNRDGLVALLSKHNVKRASEVPQAQWAALIAELGAL